VGKFDRCANCKGEGGAYFCFGGCSSGVAEEKVMGGLDGSVRGDFGRGGENKGIGFLNDFFKGRACVEEVEIAFGVLEAESTAVVINQSEIFLV
jgi:hypothetical protein